MTGVPVGIVVGAIDFLGSRDDDIETPLEFSWRLIGDEVTLVTSAGIVMWEAANRNDPIWHWLTRSSSETTTNSRGGGGPSVTTQPPPTSRPASPPSSIRGTGSGVDPSGSRGKSCPKGHYWSYKHKQCVRSKFR